jgi:hypothetical protein
VAFRLEFCQKLKAPLMTFTIQIAMAIWGNCATSATIPPTQQDCHQVGEVRQKLQDERLALDSRIVLGP